MSPGPCARDAFSQSAQADPHESAWGGWVRVTTFFHLSSTVLTFRVDMAMMLGLADAVCIGQAAAAFRACIRSASCFVSASLLMDGPSHCRPMRAPPAEFVAVCRAWGRWLDARSTCRPVSTRDATQIEQWHVGNNVVTKAVVTFEHACAPG